MKNKFFLVISLALIFFYVGVADAANEEVDNTQNQIQQQSQTVNQGEENELQDQVQTQSVQKKNIDNQTGQLVTEGNDNNTKNQVQNNNQIKNQGEGNQIKNREQEALENPATTANGLRGSSASSSQARSRVANVVKELLQVADRNGGIGEQIRVIAQSQHQNHTEIDNSLQKIQNKNKFLRFVFGPNYSELNKAKQLLAKNQEQIEQLNQIRTQLVNASDQQALSEQVELLEQARLEIQSLVNQSSGGFSLLGWMFKLFSK